MKIDDMIPSKYLKQSDVSEDILVTVTELTKVNVARDDEEADYKWTVNFKEFSKAMVLNPTNIKRMGKALGDDTDDWIGGQVVLYVDPGIEFGGNVVGGLRIRASKKGALMPAKRATVDDVNSKLRDAESPDVPF